MSNLQYTMFLLDFLIPRLCNKYCIDCGSICSKSLLYIRYFNFTTFIFVVRVMIIGILNRTGVVNWFTKRNVQQLERETHARKLVLDRCTGYETIEVSYKEHCIVRLIVEACWNAGDTHIRHRCIVASPVCRKSDTEKSSTASKCLIYFISMNCFAGSFISSVACSFFNLWCFFLCFLMTLYAFPYSIDVVFFFALQMLTD